MAEEEQNTTWLHDSWSLILTFLGLENVMPLSTRIILLSRFMSFVLAFPSMMVMVYIYICS